MDEELEAELLQVAGHEKQTGARAAKAAPPRRKQQRKRKRVVESDEEEEEEEEYQPSSEEEKVTKQRKKGRRKRKVESSEEEEEEAAEDSSEEEEEEEEEEHAGASLPAASGEEEDDEEEGEEGEVEEQEEEGEAAGGSDASSSTFGDGYETDLMGDEDDRERLAAMTELDREMELTERSERRDEIRMQRDLARRAARQEGAAAAAPARSRPRGARAAAAPAKGLPSRASTRGRDAEAAHITQRKSALSELVAAKRAQETKSSRRARAADEEDEWRSVGEGGPGSEEGGESASRSRDDAASLSDGDEGHRSASARGYSSDEDDLEKRDEEAQLEDVARVQLRRHALEQWAAGPLLERTAPGCFVRLRIRALYVLARVERVVERPPGAYKDPGHTVRSPYLLGEAGKGGTHTSKWLLCHVGNSSRLMPMDLVSNHSATRSEWRHWREQCARDGRPPLRLSDIEAAAAQLKAAAQYKYTSEDVRAMVEAKRARGGGARGNAAAERARLTALREAAEETGAAEDVARLDALLAELETAAVAAGQGPAAGAKGRVDLASLNDRNAAQNFQNAFRNVGARPGRGEATADPFSRRVTRPVNYWTTKRKGGAGELGGLSIATGGAGGGSAAPGEGPGGGGAGRGAEPQTPRTPGGGAQAVEDASGRLQLVIDLAQLARLPTGRALLARRLQGAPWAPPRVDPAMLAQRKVLSLAEYRAQVEKRGPGLGVLE